VPLLVPLLEPGFARARLQPVFVLLQPRPSPGLRMQQIEEGGSGFSTLFLHELWNFLVS